MILIIICYFQNGRQGFQTLVLRHQNIYIVQCVSICPIVYNMAEAIDDDLLQTDYYSLLNVGKEVCA